MFTMDGNQWVMYDLIKCNDKTCLTDRLISQKGTEVGHSDPTVCYGMAVVQR